MAKAILSVGKEGDGAGTVTSNLPGIACGADCSQAFEWNAAVTLTATPAPGSSLIGWSGDCAGTAPTCSLVANGAKTAVAHFASAAVPSLTISNASVSEGNSGARILTFQVTLH